MSKPCVQIMLIYTPLYCPSPCCCTAGGMVEFRRSLAASFLFKGLLFVAQQLEAEVPAYQSPFPENYRSGGGEVMESQQLAPNGSFTNADSIPSHKASAHSMPTAPPLPSCCPPHCPPLQPSSRTSGPPPTACSTTPL